MNYFFDLPEEIILYICDLIPDEQLNKFVRLDKRNNRIGQEILSLRFNEKYRKEAESILKEGYSSKKYLSAELKLNPSDRCKSIVVLDFGSIVTKGIQLIQSEWHSYFSYTNDLISKYEPYLIPKIPFILSNKLPISDQIANYGQTRFRILTFNEEDLIPLLKTLDQNKYSKHWS